MPTDAEAAQYRKSQVVAADDDNEYLDDKLKKNDPVAEAERQKKILADNTLLMDERRLLAASIPLDFVSKELALMMEARQLARDFFLHVPFLVMFVLFLFGRGSISSQYFARDSTMNFLARRPMTIQTYFPKPFLEVGNFGDIYDFLDQIAMPALFPDDVPRRLSEVRFQNQRIPLGVVRFRVKHVRNDTCDVNTNWYGPKSTFPRICYGAYSSGNEIQKSSQFNGGNVIWPYTDCSGVFQTIGGQYATYTCSGFVVDLPVNTSAKVAAATATKMRQGKIAYSVSLRYFGVEYFTFDVTQNIIASNRFIVELTEGGGFLTWVRIRVFPLYDFSDGPWIIFDVIFVLLYMSYVYRYVKDWRQTTRQQRNSWAFILNLWNIMQLINLIVFSIVFVLYAYYIGLCASLDRIDKVMNRAEYPIDIDSANEVFQVMSYLNAVNVVISFVLLLKYAQLNNQLNILQRTVLSAIAPLLSVLGIFVIVVLSYAIAGTLIFGAGNPGYRNLSYAMVSNFRALLGDFDYLVLWNENRALAFVYFWTFIILALFMMLNFIVAILMQGFTQEKAKTKAKTVAQLLHDAVTRKGATLSTIKLVIYTTFTGRSMPEVLMYEALTTNTRDMIATGEDPESASMNLNGFRTLLVRTDLETFGARHVELMWIDIVSAFEDTHGGATHIVLKERANQVYAGSRDAATAVIMDFLEQLCGTQRIRVDPGTIAAARSAGGVANMEFASEAEREIVATRLVSSRLRAAPVKLRRGQRRGHPARSLHEALLDMTLSAARLYGKPPAVDSADTTGVVCDTRRAVDRFLELRTAMQEAAGPSYELPKW